MTPTKPIEDKTPVKDAPYQFKPEELRYGNTIYYDTILEDPKKEVSVKAKELDLVCLINETFNKYYSPIELSEDILKRAGFELERGAAWKTVSDEKELTVSFALINWNPGIIHLYFRSYNRMSYGKQIRYFHQLQNLFQALTGKELTLSPTP